MSILESSTSLKRPQAGSRRLRYLIGALLACGVALPVTRLAQTRRPVPPPTTAGVNAERQYWRSRIQQNIADVDAYVRLGILEDKAGFYTAAVKYLRAARALGAPDSVVSGPLGRALTRLARDEEAMPELEKAAKLAPHSVDAVANLAGFYINQNAPDMAATVLKRFVDAHPSIQSAADANRLSLAFLECGDNQSARKMAERALQITPDKDNMSARLVVARSALEKKEFSVARRHLETMLAQAPDDAAVLYLYGIVLEAQGEDERALKQWQRTIALSPIAFDAYERVGNVYARRGDMRRAAIAYETVAQADPSQETSVRVAVALSRIKNPTPTEKGKAAYWRAIAAGFMGNYPTALQFGQVAAANPATRRQGLLAIAEAYRGMQQKQPYLSAMQKATAGGSVDDLLLMARAWGEADEHAKHTEYLRRAVAKAPSERQAAIHSELADTFRKRGMRDEAEHELEQAVQKQPDNPQFHRQLADLYFERRTIEDRLKRAISGWETAIALDPNDEADWQQLGRAYLVMGDMGKAARYLEHAIDLEPGNGPAYLELGRTYARLGDKTSSKYTLGLYTKFVAYDQERQTLRTRARREHASAEDLIAYGDFLRRTGYAAEAVTQYEKALSLRANDERLRAKLATLYSRLGMTGRQAQIGTPQIRQGIAGG